MQYKFLVSATLAFSTHLYAADLHIAAFEFSPFAIVDGSNLSGVGVDLAAKLIADTGNTRGGNSTGATKRMIELASEANYVYAMVTRGPLWEDKVHWIGKFAEDTNCFFTLKEAPVSTLEEAKKLSKVGVNAGGATEKLLVDSGFQNIDAVPNNALNFRKLEGGRIAAWYTSEYVGKYTAVKEKGDPSKYVCSGSIKKPSYWIAVSMKTDKAVVDKLKAKFVELEKSGEIAKISAKYLK